MKFKVFSKFKPSGDQPKAIQNLHSNIINKQHKKQTLLGVTGSGKTFTIAKLIEKLQKPTLVISHNKTLCAQLYRELKEFFPNNAVEYFVSYYDYYQPEAYIPQTDTYIEKDSSINDEIDRLRLSSTSSLLDRKDVIVVASVSFIYSLGSPEDYSNIILPLKIGNNISRKNILEKLVNMQYERDDTNFARSGFRVRGDVFDIHPAYSKDTVRIELFGDEIEKIKRLEAISGKLIEELDEIIIYPAKHFVTTKDKMDKAIEEIKKELNERVSLLKKQNKEFEAHRVYSRTMYDIEMMKEVGYCSGIENYSRHISGRKEGERPPTLIDYFPKGEDFLLVVDESHVTLSQIDAMYKGDRARKQTLIDFAFRLPSALDNRPLRFKEFESLTPLSIFVSATPGKYEMKHSQDIVEQIIRPTGLLDPQIEVKPSEGQIDDLVYQIKKRVEKNERTLITTLTKKMSEDLSEYLINQGIKVRYLHSEIETIERVEILKELRAKKFDCLVGINLLREGIDLPEVSLVAILDADKVGFLRSKTSLIQTSGRAARNVNGHVIMYADRITDAMKETINETLRRRNIQKEYNKKYNITPRTIKKSILDILERKYKKEEVIEKDIISIKEIKKKYNTKIPEEKLAFIKELTTEMFNYSEKLEFEKAAKIRDAIKLEIKKKTA